MNKKILCPWCGSEMELMSRVIESCGIAFRRARYECSGCGAMSQEIEEKDYGMAAKIAYLAALRRYTPPIKPMSFEAVLTLTTDDELWMEERGDGAVRVCRCLINGLDKRITAQYIASYPKEFDHTDYGRTWRFWERKPTQEEREAAKWET